jgi:DNA polymerase III delta prime subunit
MIGQRCIQQQIKSEIEAKSLARFIILVGERGSGRKTLAKEIARLTDAEYVVVDKGVEAIRQVIEQCYTVATDVLYVLDGDNMSPSAKSSLLKVTEEPPNRARFVLTVSDIGQTLNTLTSRARVFRMDLYTDADIAYFAGTEDVRYANFCTNKFEVDFLKNYGMDDFSNFIQLVVDNVAEVSSSNAFKIEEKIALKGEEDKIDMKIFLQAFRVVCYQRVQDSQDYWEKLKFLQWIETTSAILSELRVSTVNKPMLFDKWIFNVREVARNATD